MESLADFKAAAVYFAKKLVDECHINVIGGDKRMESVTLGDLHIQFCTEYRQGKLAVVATPPPGVLTPE